MEHKKYEALAEKFKVLAHPVRICIVSRLSQKERMVGEMCECLQAPQPTISLHLARLKSAGIVECERQGNNVLYRIKDKKLAKLVADLLE